MTVTFYQYPKCTTCKRAKKELESLVDDFNAVDIKLDPPGTEQLKGWMENSDYTIKQFFNTSGQSYRDLGLKDRIDTLSLDEAAQLLSTDGMLIKRPILLQDDKVLQIGYRKPYAEILAK